MTRVQGLVSWMLAVGLLMVAGCGSKEEKKIFRVGLVPDMGRVDDNTFNEAAHNGAMQAANDNTLNVQYDYAKPQANENWESQIDKFAQQGFDMIIGVGFLMAEVTEKKAKEYPAIKFAIVDNSYTSYPANLTGILFREDQAGYLAGVLAGKVTTSKKIGAIGGMEIPPVKKFCNGFKKGMLSVCSDCAEETIYTGSFSDSALGTGAADQLISNGNDIVFGVGGGMGSAGILHAAGKGVKVIGVDLDEWFTTFQNGNEPGSDKLLTSAMKRVDVSVYEVIKEAAQGTLQSGDKIFSAKNDGVGLAEFHSTAAQIPEAVKTLLTETFDKLANETLNTGVDPNTGDMLP